MSSAAQIWDVVVIGGGPAGMMAATQAAHRGARVLLLEKNPGLGKKLLITGGGRCNVTNRSAVSRTTGTFNARAMLARYGESEPFLFSAFSQYGVTETMSFFESHGVKLKEENDGRLFPVSNSARSIWQVLAHELKTTGVTVKPKSQVESVTYEAQEGVFYVVVRGTAEVVRGRRCVVATGGTSHPETGSTGEGFAWLQKLGHTIRANNFALVPLITQEAWSKTLGGLALNDVKIVVLVDGVRQFTRIGRVLFTHFGLSGPTILNMAREVGDLLPNGEVVLALDLFPKLDAGAVRRTLQEVLVRESNKKIKNVLGELVPSGLVAPLLTLSTIDGETFSHSVSTESRKRLVTLLKHLPLTVEGLMGADKAIVSSGGVALTEVDFKTMQSRLVPGLYLVGDVLDIDRPSGGYSLQLCWTTGFVAGNHAGEKKSAGQVLTK